MIMGLEHHSPNSFSQCLSPIWKVIARHPFVSMSVEDITFSDGRFFRLELVILFFSTLLLIMFLHVCCFAFRLHAYTP